MFDPISYAMGKAAGGGGGSAPVIQALSATANGTYTAPSGVDGYSPVTVNVSSGGVIPPEYQRIPALYAPGGAWFTMPENTKANMGFDITMKPTGSYSERNGNLFGGSMGSTEVGDWRSIFFTVAYGTITYFAEASLATSDIISFPSHDIDTIACCSVRRHGNTVVYTDTGSNSGTRTITSGAEPVGAPWAFCTFVDENGVPRSETKEHFLGYIYGAAFYSGDTAIHDMLPVKETQTGRCGMYDIVMRAFFSSEGSAEFRERA